MSYIIVGLGNPGADYDGSRHNAGRMAVEAWALKQQKAGNLSDWKFDKLMNAQKASGEVEGEKVLVLLPDTFMNNSGKSLKDKIKNPKQASKLIVVHDDLDLPLGKMKIVFDRSSGGHKGVESIIRALKTSAFGRIRLGICPTTPSGKPKKPVGDKLIDFVIKSFKPDEEKIFTQIKKRVSLALDLILAEDLSRAMGEFNGK